MRGRERVVVALLLAGTSAATGALAGFVAGAAWSVAAGATAAPPWPAMIAVVGLAVVLDAAGVAPLSVRRQVPQLWGRVFAPPTVAVLYGARLGVGPLTVLRTWLWWAALVVGASTGPWWSAAVGATFGLARIVAMVVVGTRAGALQQRERRATWALASFVVAAVTVLAWAAAPSPAPGERAGEAAPAGAADDRDAVDGAPGPAATDPASAAASTSLPAVPDQGLGGVLPADVLPGLGFERVPDDPVRHLGPLDLRAAAAVEQDEPAERALLETRRFVRGQARAWRAADGRVAYASVYEFASAADADAYLRDGLTTIEARGARVYAVDAPAGAQGFSQAEQASTGAGSTVSHGVVFVRGARFALVFVTSRDSSLGPAEASAAGVGVASAVGG